MQFLASHNLATTALRGKTGLVLRLAPGGLQKVSRLEEEQGPPGTWGGGLLFKEGPLQGPSQGAPIEGPLQAAPLQRP